MNTQSGWFPDPSDPNVEVYFDGESWTGEKRAKNQNTAQVFQLQIRMLFGYH